MGQACAPCEQAATGGDTPLSARAFSRGTEEEERDGPSKFTDVRMNASKLGASKLLHGINKQQDDGWCFTGTGGSCCVQRGSIYGAALAMPQIARSCGWPGTLSAMVVNTWFFACLNFMMQAYILSMIGEEFNLWFPFAGRMHLCDFGRSIKDCPGGSDCVGPRGTTLSYPRLYDFDVWGTRIFVQDSIKVAHATDTDISDKVDPGEYGLENFYCRMVCIFLFLKSTLNDFSDNIDNFKTLLLTPTTAESWIGMSIPDWASKNDVKAFDGLEELDLVEFRVAGIPLHWKVFNAIFILLPKNLLWLGVTRSGVHYLMETAGIVNVVVNAMALTFILNVDEMIFEKLIPEYTTHILTNIKELDLSEDDLDETDEQALARYEKEEMKMSFLSILWKVVPIQLIVVFIALALFLTDYYISNCELRDGSWVSKAMYLPSQVHGNLLRFMFGIEAPLQSEAFWTMPAEVSS